ncbi:MAG: hypothetical protein FWD39_03255 [Clostridiales bacterium]|nr:hypothetical protein [Clostridiales bacterium]
MKTRKISLILMVLLLFTFIVLAAGCGDKLTACEVCEQETCVCGEQPAVCKVCEQETCVCGEQPTTCEACKQETCVCPVIPPVNTCETCKQEPCACGEQPTTCKICKQETCVCYEYPDGSWDGVWLGKGTAGDPLQVSNAAQLAEIARLVNFGELETAILGNADGTVYIKLMNNIILSVYAPKIPIGTEKNPFKGVFEGNNKTISGLLIEDNKLVFAGLFGYISGGTVKNLRIENAKVIGINYVGGVAGAVRDGRLENCFFAGTVSGANYVGGVTGAVWDGRLENCSFAGAVSGAGNYVGGVVGTIIDKTHVEKCYATGTVKGKDYVGGVMGYGDGYWASYHDTHLHGNSRVINCYAASDVSGTLYVGGVVGYSKYFFIENCYATGKVNGFHNVGGMAGTIIGVAYFEETTTNLKGCYAKGAVSGTGSYVGGVAGSVSNSTLENCYATGNVSGEQHSVGGVVGSITCGSVTNCYATGTVKGKSHVGGVVGIFGAPGFMMGSMANCYATGAVSGTDSYVGGVIGYVAMLSPESRIENCLALNPSISGKSNVGRVFGIIGEYALERWSASFAFNNTAFSGMIVTENGAAKTLDKGADKVDGADISAAAILTDGTLGGRFTAAGGWTVQNGRLPGFGAPVNMLAHIK